MTQRSKTRQEQFLAGFVVYGPRLDPPPRQAISVSWDRRPARPFIQPPVSGFLSGKSLMANDNVNKQALLSGATATGAGDGKANFAGVKTYQAAGSTTAGTGSATIAVQGTNDGANWDTIGTITLTLGTTSASDSFASDDRYEVVRGNVTAISGTGASVSLTMGY